MKVLVDTCVWSQALRKHPGDALVQTHLRTLIVAGRAEIIGPIRQELLSGISRPEVFAQLLLRLTAFPDLPLTTAHFELAAELANACRRSGIQGSPTDLLLCAVAKHEKMPIFTTDGDFARYDQVIGLPLYEPG